MLNRFRHYHINESGSLLINLIVSIAIFSFLATISVPAYLKFKPSIELNGASRDLVADLRYAQQLTISEQIPYAVEIEPVFNRYSILSLNIATSTIKTVVLPVNVEFQSISGFTNDLIRYNSYGAVSEAGDITLTNNFGKTKLITIKPSGYVQGTQ